MIRLKELGHFTDAIFSIVNEADPLRVPKRLQLENWCRSFSVLYNSSGAGCIPFFLDILSDPQSWEETDTIHRIKLNRRIVAKKMIQLQSWRGVNNPLNDCHRYQIACWCCLDEDIPHLFELMKRHKMKHDDAAELRRLVMELSRGHGSDSLMGYWSHIMGGFAADLQADGKHLFECGLHCTFLMCSGYVEAVEFFWNKIKSLPDHELNAQQKDEIFMNTALAAGGNHFGIFPEILEFCITQMSPEKYPELMQREFSQHNDYRSLGALQDNFCFDQCRILFDCLGPQDISEKIYCDILKNLGKTEHSECYARDVLTLFMHMWTREGFHRHRDYVLRNEMNSSTDQGNFLLPFVTNNYMDLVWAILDSTPASDVKFFMDTSRASYICTVLQNRNDQYSLNNFLSYRVATRNVDQPGTSRDNSDLNTTPTKRPRIQ